MTDQLNPMAVMIMQVFLGNLRKWIREDPDKAIEEIDKAIAALKE